MKTKKTTKPLKWYLDQWKMLECTLLEDSELCKILGVHPVTTRRWRQKGLLPFIRIDRRPCYRMSEVLGIMSRKLEDGRRKTVDGSRRNIEY